MESSIPELRFVSLGMVVLDEIRFPHRSSLHDIPGGSGAYGESCTGISLILSILLMRLTATLGARVAAGARDSKSIGCVILTGDDFPDVVLEAFRS